MTVVDVVITDQSGLFEKITGALAVTGLNILGARAITRNDGFAIDVFYVEGKTAALWKTRPFVVSLRTPWKVFSPIRIVRPSKFPHTEKKKEKSKTFATTDKFGATIPPQVDVYRDISLGRTIVEVRAADRIGLLHLISKHIADAGFSILFARIATEQGIATDVFNIEPLEKGSVPSSRTFLDLREKIGKALYEGKYYHEV